jgi:hypothetical protein
LPFKKYFSVNPINNFYLHLLGQTNWVSWRVILGLGRFMQNGLAYYATLGHCKLFEIHHSSLQKLFFCYALSASASGGWI